MNKPMHNWKLIISQQLSDGRSLKVWKDPDGGFVLYLNDEMASRHRTLASVCFYIEKEYRTMLTY